MSTHQAARTAAGPALRHFFLRPPRRHGEVDHGQLFLSHCSLEELQMMGSFWARLNDG